MAQDHPEAEGKATDDAPAPAPRTLRDADIATRMRRSGPSGGGGAPTDVDTDQASGNAAAPDAAGDAAPATDRDTD